MNPREQQLLNKLLVALTCTVVRTNPPARQKIVEILALEHPQLVVDAVARRSVAG